MSERDPLSMSTDNTADGEMYSDTVEGGPISRVMIGDSVSTQPARKSARSSSSRWVIRTR